MDTGNKLTGAGGMQIIDDLLLHGVSLEDCTYNTIICDDYAEVAVFKINNIDMMTILNYTGKPQFSYAPLTGEKITDFQLASGSARAYKNLE